jgi:hypothetical protein
VNSPRSVVQERRNSLIRTFVELDKAIRTALKGRILRRDFIFLIGFFYSLLASFWAFGRNLIVGCFFSSECLYHFLDKKHIFLRFYKQLHNSNYLATIPLFREVSTGNWVEFASPFHDATYFVSQRV